MIRKTILESIKVKQLIADDPALIGQIEKAIRLIIHSLQHEGKIFFCGNGGSAADAQHLAAELSGRFYLDRDPLPAEAIHVNTSFLTAVSNDYSFETAYARYIEGHGRHGDVLVAISTSGNSVNIVNALKVACRKKLVTISLTGEGGGRMKEGSDLLIAVPSTDTPRIQESHILLGHIICEQVEKTLFGKA
jgi:D-sedoheptulose 7-phosphate isomerase